MKKYKIILLLITLFIGSSYVMAEDCDSSDIARLKVLANNIDITYEYNEDYVDEYGFKSLETYKVMFNNMSDELKVVDYKEWIDYETYPIVDSVLTINGVYNGNHTFKIYSKKCDKSLKSYYVKLPIFNYYSTDPNCEGKDNLEVCQKFYDTSRIDYNEFYNIVSNYSSTDATSQVIENNDSNIINVNIIFNFLKQYYLFIIIGIIVLVVATYLILRISRKRRVLE